MEIGSKVYYVGKAEEQGGFKRAKDHLRGQMDSVGRCIIEKASTKNKDDVNIWPGWIEEGQNKLFIDDAEKLLTSFYGSPCNKTNKEKYNGRPLYLNNEGDLPPGLSPEIQSPS